MNANLLHTACWRMLDLIIVSMKISEALKEGCNADAPGLFAAWLSYRVPVRAYPIPGKRYDIGNLEGYSHVQNAYRGIVGR